MAKPVRKLNSLAKNQIVNQRASLSLWERAGVRESSGVRLTMMIQTYD